MQTSKEQFQEMREAEMQDNLMPYITNGLRKSEISGLAKVAVDTLLENGNPLSVAENLSAMENFVAEVKKDPRFIDYVREEAKKFNGTFTSSSGAKIELAEVGTKYVFDQCGDPKLVELQDMFDRADYALKERKEFLKTVPKSGLEIVDKESGDVSTVYPPAKSSTSSFKITLAK